MDGLLNTILLVDDDNIANFVHHNTLSDLNISRNIIYCENGKQAIEMIKQIASEAEKDSKELILLDINMPEMNGIEFLQEYIKIKPKNIKVRIFVMLTAILNDEDSRKINKMKHIIDEFVEKPLGGDKIKRLIEKHF